MASMDLETIIRDLNKRFAAPLSEFYKRRIIFWYDEDREFENRLWDIELADESGLQMPQKEEFQIDIAFAVDEFDFFS